MSARDPLIEECNAIKERKMSRKGKLSDCIVAHHFVWLWIFIMRSNGVACQSDRSQTFHIAENRASGALVGTIGKGMRDFSPPFSTHITRQVVKDSFRINENTGRITTKLLLDYEKNNRYDFIVFNHFNVYMEVIIFVDDLNDNSPVFTPSFQIIRLPESSPKEETKIQLISVVDKDLGVNSVQGCKIIRGNDDGAFRLSVKKGGPKRLLLDLIVQKLLDREMKDAYDLVIEAYDGGTPPNIGHLKVNITVLDVNDHQPVFKPSYYTVVIEENRSVGSKVVEVSAYDKDAGDNGAIRYSINHRKSDKVNIFTMNPTSGVVSLNKPLNYERKKTFQLIVLATDRGSPPREGSAVVSVTVSNVNERPPKIAVIFLANVNQSADIAEDSLPGSLVARVSISDPDATEKTDSQLSVKLSGDEGFFRLSPKGQNVYMLSVKRKLDREKRSSYNLTLTAVDSGSPPLTSVKSFTLRIADVNDNPPVFLLPRYTAEIQEAVQTGSFVIQVSARDADEGRNSDIRYSIIPSQFDWFDIDSRSGLITTKSTLDCEAQPVSRITVVATDRGEPSMFSSVQVTVKIRDYNDNQPIFDNGVYTASLSENLTVNSCFLTVSATDPDCGVDARVIYSLSNDSDSTRPSQFRLDAISGELCLQEALDYENVTFFEFAVQAEDHDGLSSVAMVQITVQDANDDHPTFYPGRYSCTVPRHAGTGTAVVTVKAWDADSGRFGEVQYTLKGSDSHDFAIDPRTGVITLARQLSTDGVITLSVDAFDGGGLRADNSAVVTINVIGGDESPPIFTSALYQFTARENIGKGKFVGSVAIKPHSSSGNAVYSIQDGDKHRLFSIDSSTGDISTAQDLDHEQVTYVLLNVKAQLPNSLVFGHAQVKVTIEDINDNRPYFHLRRIKLSVSEDAKRDSVIYTVRAIDRDSGRNGRVRYELITNTHNTFTIHPNSGVLSLEEELDYERKKSYELLVQAKDSAAVSLSAEVTLLISVQDTNDNSPQFLESSYIFKLSEDTSVNSKFAFVNATDRDSGNNGQIVYRILPSNDVFGVFPSDGYLYLKKSLNRELVAEYSFDVVATDNGKPRRSVTAKITIIITDSNDNTPVFTQSLYTFTILETTKSDVFIGKVVATDTDIGDNSALTYEVSGENKYFTIGYKTGEIRSKQILDREIQSRHEFRVSVTDQGVEQRRAEAIVRVLVDDVNDNSPSFLLNEPYVEYVSENKKKGTFVMRMVAADPDEGANGRVSYSLSEAMLAPNSDADSSSFRIHRTSGVITTDDVLDYEEKAHFSLVVFASDSGNPSKLTLAEVEIHVRDEVNEIQINPSQEIQFSAVENIAIPTVIGRVKSDARKVSYRLFAGDVFNCFNINIQTGEIFTVRQIDYEEASRHVLGVKVVDVGAYVQTTTTVKVTINVVDVNDNAPEFDDDLVVLAVKENSPVTLAIVDLYARDADSDVNASVKYRIVSQIPYKSLVINGHGRLISVDPFDYETSRQVHAVVEARDSSPLKSVRRRSTVTVLLRILDENDNSPVFASDSVIYVEEGRPPGHAVTRVVARDRDGEGNNKVAYRCIRGNEDGQFALDKTSGMLSLSHPLDRERASVYTLEVQASDSGAPSRTTDSKLIVHVLDVNDNPPTFTAGVYEGSVMEHVADIIQTVATVTATDRDIGENAMLEYFIADAQIAKLFSVDQRSGVITTQAELDRETRSHYSFIVYVKDGGIPRLYGNATVRVTVKDINDHAPKFARSAVSRSVGENTRFTMRLLATDDDDGANGRVTYSIVGGNPTPPVFYINPETGELSSSSLDREQRSSYTLKIRATDAGTPAKSGECTVTVNLLDENDNSPTFVDALETATVAEDVGVGETVMTVTASDSDDGVNSRVTYSLGDDSGLFRIDATSGRITTAGLFDRETQDKYTLSVNATDGALSQPLHSSMSLTVQISDVNDNAPVFTDFPYRKTVATNIGKDTTVIRVKAVDNDVGVNQDITYTIVGTDAFTIKPKSGVIKTNRAISSSAFFILRVIATDGGTPAKSSTGIVEITVGKPTTPTFPLQFARPTYMKTMDEHSPLDTEVEEVQVVGTSDVTYSITDGNAADVFAIDSSSGKIRVHNPALLNYETQASHNISVLAQAGTRYGYTTVTVELRDINDHSPVFSQDRYTTSIREKESPRTFVTHIRAIDSDSSHGNLDLRYTIISGNTDSSFSIDPATGVIRSNIILDREVREVYHLGIQALDRGSPMRSGTCQLDVIVADVNDNKPYFKKFGPLSVAEDAPVGSIITTIFATDVDLEPRITYRFVKGGNPDDIFNIDAYTGEITLRRQLDYEHTKKYELKIQAFDGVNRAMTTLTLSVLDTNDNSPMFEEEIYFSEVSENKGRGAELVKVHATDADSGENGRISYSISHPVGSPDNYGFYVNQRTGSIYQKHSSVQSSELFLIATDNGTTQRSSEVLVVVTVDRSIDFTPKFLYSSFEVHIREDKKRGTFVSGLPVDAANLQHAVDYHIVDGNDDKIFYLNQTSGQLYVDAELDRETASSFSLKVVARNRRHKTLSGSILVRVLVDDYNDNIPVFTKDFYHVEVDEGTSGDGALVQVLASDRDVGENAALIYEVTSGDDSEMFDVHSRSGEVSLKAGKKLDYEAMSHYTLVVKVTDCSRCDTAVPRFVSFTKVAIKLRDVNEFTPQFPVAVYSIVIPENASPGTEMFRVVAYDGDGGKYGKLKYQLRHRLDPKYLTIDSNTGVIKADKNIETVTRKHGDYRFEITATDSGNLSGSVRAMVIIDSVDEYAPRFDSGTYNFSLPGNAKVGYVLGTVHARDRDAGVHGHVEYYIDGENDYIAVNRSSGVIYVVHDLQKELRRRRAVVRRKRSLQTDHVSITVVANSGGLQSRVVIDITVDRTCDGCQVLQISHSTSRGLASKYIIAIVVTVIVVIVLAAIVVFIFVRRRFHKRAPPPSDHYNHGSFDVRDVPPTTILPNNGLPSYNDIRFDRLIGNGNAVDKSHNSTHENINNSISQNSHNSVSSGHGSVEEPDVDEEIQMITANSYDPTHVNYHSVMPDSGIQTEDSVSELCVQNHQEYLARLGIDTTAMNCNQNKQGNPPSTSHSRQLGSAERGKFSYENAIGLSDLNGDHGFGDSELPQHRASLSNVINSEEEFSGSYNWDYLLDWGPRYQPLAEVFSEIARLKDDSPKLSERHAQQRSGNAVVRNGGPPPIITSTPPTVLRLHSLDSNDDVRHSNVYDYERKHRITHRGGCNRGYVSEHELEYDSDAHRGRSNNGHQRKYNHNHAPQMRPSHRNDAPLQRPSRSNHPSLPQSPVGHDSSFSPVAMVPSFTPSLSPLASHSPSIASFSSLRSPSLGAHDTSSVHSGSESSAPIKGSQPSVVVFNNSPCDREFRI